jgi:ferredoxin--NADP+ reductase
MSDPSPLRFAIVGAGPSGFYAAAELLRLVPGARIDLYERLCAPHGLVRYGVAPDHAKTKAVTRAFDRIAADPRVRFRGNVRVGRDVSVEELRAAHAAVLFTHGSDAGRRLGIPGEDLANVHTSVDFVGWYNGHPDHQNLRPDFSRATAVVVGNGNVALDVARILVRPVADLAATDIATPALDALRESSVRRVVLLGRRGPAQAAFTPSELHELAHLPGVALQVDPRELELSAEDLAEVEADTSQRGRQCMDILRAAAGAPAASEADRVVELRFLTSPVAVEGDDNVARVILGRNRLEGASGRRRAVDTGEREILVAGLVVGSIGYLGARIEGLPFDDRAQVVPSEAGRVTGLPGVYCAGWIRRGAQGVIGNNKRCAAETVASVVADLPGLPSPMRPAESIDQLLVERGVRIFTWADWQRLDAIEAAAGQPLGRPRIKTLSNQAALDLVPQETA